jgi:glycosyltransferase involved in cell wall biosynthesis
MKGQVTAIVLAKNESGCIKNCLDSLKWCEEIIVIDDDSTDDTVTIAKKYGTRIISNHLNGDFAAQRNLGLEHASQPWVLFVDADEIIPNELRDEILEKINDDRYDGFLIQRTDHLWGAVLKYGETGDIWLLRLARKDAGHWYGKVHETWIIDGEVEKLKNRILHYPHGTIADFLEQINIYTDLRAEELLSDGRKASAVAIIVYPVGKFLTNYIMKRGFMDGVQGLIHALMMSFHSFLVRSKLYQLQHETK